MELNTFTYFKKTGWSVDTFPAMDSPTTAVMMFCAPEYVQDQAPVRAVLDAYPNSFVIGCSTAGEISDDSVFDASITVAVMKFKETQLDQSCVEAKTADDSFEAGKKLAESLNKENLKGVFVLSDGLNINGSELIKGINHILPENVIVTGGLAGDGSRFKDTWVVCKRKIQKNHVAAIGFYGEKICIGHASKGGWDGFGPERRITKSKKNVLYELDGKPALALYKEYLGDRAEDLPAAGLLFPLAIRKNSEDEKEIVRTILAVDEKKQTLTFAGDVPSGYLARLMRANFDRLIAGANLAAASIQVNRAEGSENPILVVAISCVGRRLLLGEYTEEELESTLEALPKDVKQIGFYSYGEISPYGQGRCDLHNQTMTLTTFYENES